MPETLLVEILTEELPPKSLRALSEAFRDRLLGDLAGDLGAVYKVDAAGVDQLEAEAVPFAFERPAVACDAGLGVGDCLAASSETVDQGALADVGKSDDGDLFHARPRSRASSTTRSTTSSGV